MIQRGRVKERKREAVQRAVQAGSAVQGGRVVAVQRQAAVR